ncbi:hypothetical protein G7Y89_g8663 [Cudoniella acicularis]|uniref:DUF4149 domain-containing protein n=1 Tax=Cudoniella acicularis TaxID=354080 RepID=A0A8H4RH32_9HELO|nr:hypothetical protein G7Y89_g8663 [Cudoniella acicularis]
MPDLSLFKSPAPYHIIAYGSLLGTQFFQSFIGSVVAYKTLTRPQFSQLQQKIFPIYFGIQTALPVVLALTYPGSGNPLGTASGLSGTFAETNRWSVLVPVATMFVTGLVNMVFIGPATTKLMRERKVQETRDGKKSYDPPPHSQEMQELNQAFSKMHSISSLVNLGAFIAALWLRNRTYAHGINDAELRLPWLSVVRLKKLSKRRLAKSTFTRSVSQLLGSSQKPTTMGSFTLFRKLPPELRLQIWEYTKPEARTIEFTWNSKARSIVSTTATPTILHLCQESRQLFIRAYTPVQFGESTHITLIDFNQDTIFFGRGCQRSVPSGLTNSWVMHNLKIIHDISTSVSLQQNLRIAAFDCGFIRAIESGNRSQGMQDILRKLENLSEIILVRGKPSKRDENVRCNHTGTHSFMAIENNECERCVETCSAYQRMYLAYEAAGIEREIKFSSCDVIPGELVRAARGLDSGTRSVVSGLDFVARVRSRSSASTDTP